MACEMPAGVGGFISFHFDEVKISQFTRSEFFCSIAYPMYAAVTKKIRPEQITADKDAGKDKRF